MRNILLPLAAAGVVLISGCATTTSTPPSGHEATPSTQHSNAMEPLAAAPPRWSGATIRVGLLSDQSSVTFERIDGGYVIVAGEKAYALRRGFTAHGPVQDAPRTFGVQVAALSDQASAQTLADKLTREAGQPATLLFDAKGGVYRVIAGDFPTEDAARPVVGTLTAAGYGKGMMIVPRPSTRQFVKSVTIVDDEGATQSFDGESILVLPATAKSVRIGDSPYRGGARLFVNTRGSLNVINELGLEDYVRGVVPSEMGPKVYDELEAIKAQALAARTYAVRRLGEFRTEGFDICPTPACQVYKGMSIEEALSDQAVAETAGMIITYNGEPIDALFTAACGGATSDAATMFPGRTEPYLKGVSCIEGDLRTLQGRADGPLQSEWQLDARLFESLSGVNASGSWSARDVVAATEAAAHLAGVTLPLQPVLGGNAPKNAALTPPASSRRRDVLRYLGAALGATSHGAALTYPEDRQYFFPSQDAATDEALAAAFLVKYRIVPAQNIDRVDLDAAMPRDELYALLASWLRKRDLISEANGRIAGVEGRKLSLKAAGKVTTFDLPLTAALYRKTLDRLQEYASLPYMVGDRATVVRNRDGAIVAVVVQTNYDGAAFDRTSSFSSWVRSYRADELVQSINRRNPIQQLVDLKPVAVDPARRVSALDVVAENNRVIHLTGIVIRWSLNLPDNLFTFERSTDPDGVARFTFYGKGWGHGTGMCQEGAFGMAMRGWKAEQIVKHYYSGVAITPFVSR